VPRAYSEKSLTARHAGSKKSSAGRRWLAACAALASVPAGGMQIHARMERLRVAKEKADERIEQARELERRAREARTNIVRRVFNDSLNAL
jgi:DNA repair protein SbcC/Rad50